MGRDPENGHAFIIHQPNSHPASHGKDIHQDQQGKHPASAPDNARSSDRLTKSDKEFGKAVYGAEKKKIGSIDHVMIDQSTGACKEGGSKTNALQPLIEAQYLNSGIALRLSFVTFKTARSGYHSLFVSGVFPADVFPASLENFRLLMATST